MHGNLPAPVADAISLTPVSGTEVVPEAGANPGSGTEPDWFVSVAFDVFGKKEAGLLLHYATGWPRTSCYAFVARDPDQRRKPSPEFLRRLCHSNHGKPFLLAFMSGCTAEWWLEYERAQRIAEAIAAVE